MNVSEKYALLVINTREQQGQAAYSLAESLFHQLNKFTATKRPSLSVSIRPVISDSEQAASWLVNLESSRSIKQCLVKEFFFPPTAGPNTRAYLLWIFQAPTRAGEYLLRKLPEMWRQATTNSQKALGILRITGEALEVTFETLFFVYFVPLMVFTVIRPLRKMGTLAFVFYLFALVTIVVSLTWEQTLIPFVAWISQFTHQIIGLVADIELTFDILFPVIASAFFGAGLGIVIILGRLVRWVVGKLDIIPEGTLRIMGELSYLLDPLYATKVRDSFERQLIDLNESPNVQRIFVVSDGKGALLAYEVLSRACRGKISTPVYLLTCNLSLAGFAASPYRSLWLLVDYTYWWRFSVTTPRKLSWHHLTRWPRREYTVKLTSRLGHRLPQVKLHYEKHHWFKGANTVLIDHLITLLNLA